jgi:hypothetical protein
LAAARSVTADLACSSADESTPEEATSGPLLNSESLFASVAVPPGWFNAKPSWCSTDRLLPGPGSEEPALATGSARPATFPFPAADARELLDKVWPESAIKAGWFVAG